MIAFKVDENLPIEACELLRAEGFDTLTVLDQGLGGRPDADIAAVCRAERRAILTFDLDFSNTTRYPPASHPGIIVLRLARQDRPYVLDVLRTLIPHLDEASLSGHLWIVEDTRIRIRE